MSLSAKETLVATNVLKTVLIIDLLWYLPSLILARRYYQGLLYEIKDDEVLIKAGISTSSEKHISYRGITDMTVKRDVLDRWLEISSLTVRFACVDDSTCIVESMKGVSAVQDVYEEINKRVEAYWLLHGKDTYGEIPELEGKSPTGGNGHRYSTNGTVIQAAEGIKKGD
jgi:uncharacterized membrane protein YdbT with pleckstrin-like domain